MSLPRQPSPRPFLKWLGGKRQLLPELLKAVQMAGKFNHYHEPFLGGGALYFALARTGQLRGGSYITDVNPSLIDTYLGLRDELDGVIAELRVHKRRHCKKYFYQIRASNPRKITKRAARVIYLNRTCFNGLYRENSRGQFNAPFGRYKNPLICDEENLRAVSWTLRSADISAKGFATALQVARRDDLVYLDPPYNPTSKTADFTSYSRDGFDADAHIELAKTFDNLAERGVKVILTNSMTPFTRALYRNHYCYQVLATRRINSRGDGRGKIPEVLITSFPLNPSSQRSKKQKYSQLDLPLSVTGGLERMQARHWLIENNYSDIATLIDDVQQEWRVAGKRTRRNWWEILAGGADGKPRIVGGRPFPVLRAAQRRQGVPETDNAECRNSREDFPFIQLTGRWK